MGAFLLFLAWLPWWHRFYRKSKINVWGFFPLYLMLLMVYYYAVEELKFAIKRTKLNGNR